MTFHSSDRHYNISFEIKRKCKEQLSIRERCNVLFHRQGLGFKGSFTEIRSAVSGYLLHYNTAKILPDLLQAPVNRALLLDISEDRITKIIYWLSMLDEWAR